MQFELMELPFDEAALEPYVSAETIAYHYGKHHAGYVNKLNLLLENSDLKGKPLDYIIKNADGAIFNNAAQVYNHDFYWLGLAKKDTEPSVALRDTIEKQFGSMESFKEKFIEAATGLFGSGWTWLVFEKGELSIQQYFNADNPLRHHTIPLLTCDVWEHAYYIDYRNVRKDYIEKWFEIVNWEFVSDNFADAQSDHMSGYAQPCNDNSEVCEYVDEMQRNEDTAS
jgi:superoxide dismutase, Fe-Mn family